MKNRLLASILGAAAVIGLNVAVPSYLNFYYWEGWKFAAWRRFVAYIVDLHAFKAAPFVRRPVTTLLIRAIELPGLDPWWAFVIAQFLLLVLSAWVLGLVAEKLWKGSGERSILVYFASFTVLHSFATPNDAYDEGGQYLLLFLAVLFSLEERPVWFAVSFLGALIARETSILLAPSMLMLWPSRKGRAFTATLLPILAYGFYLAWHGGEDDPNRLLYWQRNFADIRTAGESFVSLGLALGLPLSLWLFSREADRRWGKAFLAGLALNTPAVFAFAYARESRLFSLPLVFLWPLCGKILRGPLSLDRAAGWKKKLFWPATIGTGLLLAFLYDPGYRSRFSYKMSAVIYGVLLVTAAFFRGKSSPESSSP